MPLPPPYHVRFHCHTHSSLSCVPSFTVHPPPQDAHPLLPFAPPSAMHAFFAMYVPHAYLSHPCAPLLCVFLEYKFYKVIIHSTTWTFGPLTASYLGNDYSLYIHSGHAQGCSCMHIRFHVFFLIHCRCLSIRRPYQTIGIILQLLVLGVTQRILPSMDMVEDQTRGPTLTDAQR